MKKVFIVMMMILISFAVMGNRGWCEDDVIDACYETRNGIMRYVEGLDDCRPSEEAISWNIEGPPGSDGIHCWDLNMNGVCDLGTEDVNEDTLCDVQDCKGPQGECNCNGSSNEIPIIWAGSCSNDEGCMGNQVYCTDIVDINTAGDYLSVGTDGIFTVLTGGIYRLSFSNNWPSTCSQNFILLKINGVTRTGASGVISEVILDNIYSLDEGDTFHFMYRGRIILDQPSTQYHRINIQYLGPNPSL